jgi:hypothetical protein
MAAARQQVRLNATLFNEWKNADGKTWMSFYRTPADYLLRFPDLADFQISRNGRNVHCWPVPGTSEETVRHLYLNQVLPLTLSKNGKLLFHGSAVEIGSEAIAFLGTSGRGKSTLAASFATTGFRFLTDDGLELQSRDGVCEILPSHPSIRLWEDSHLALIPEGARIAPPVQFTSKARLLAGDEIAFCNAPRNLRRVYFLGECSPQETTFACMSPSEALIELVKNSFLLDTGEREMLAAHFNELSSLVKLPIFYRLEYPRQFADLARVRQAIVEHVLAGSDTP